MKTADTDRPRVTAVEKLQAENEELRRRLTEAEETIEAIRSGAVDALVVEEPSGHRIYTLESAERPYRLFVEEMQQGAATLQKDGTIVWCNRQLAMLLKTPQEKLIGACLREFICEKSRVAYDNLLWQGQTRSGRGEAHLQRADDAPVPAFLTFSALPEDCGSAIGVLITDLTPQRHHEQLTAAHAALRESERRFREMIDALPAAIYTTDAEGRLTHFNPAAVEFSGRTPELGTDQWCVSFKLYNADGTPLPHDKCPMAIALKEGRIVRGVEAIAERPDGQRRWFTPYPTPLRDSAGKIVGGINLLLDITERKQAEQALRRSERELRDFFDNATVGLHQVASNGLILRVNQTELDMLGYIREEYVGHHMSEFHVDAEVIEEILQSLADGHSLNERPARMRCKDGSIKEVVISSNVLWENGKFIHTRCFTRDVTERNRIEAELRRVSEFDEAVMTNMAEGLYTVDDQGMVTSMNPAAEKFFGWTFGELRGRKMHDMTHHHHPDGRPFPAEECAGFQVLKQGKTLTGHEDVFIRKDGTFFPVIYSSSPIREGDKITGLVVVFRDITEQQQAEAVERRLAAIVESSSDAILSKDLDGTIISWNAGAEKLFGYTAEETIGHPVTMLMPPERYNEEPDILARIRRGESIEHYETVRRRKDGILMDISLTVSPIVDGHGHVIGASKIARDITDRKQYEEALRLAQAQLADRAGQLEQAVAERTTELTEMNKQLEAFVYSIAHDLRAPLRSMQGFSEMLLEEGGAGLGVAGRNYAKRISRSAQFMDALLQDLLAFSRLNQQRIELVPVDLASLVHSVLARLEDEITKKNARLEILGPWPSVLAHEPTLGQVLFNLVSNALKFVAPDVVPAVRIRAQEWAAVAPPSTGSTKKQLSGNWVRVWVEDNGIGIAPKHQDQIFRLFSRLHGEKYPGTGVGLAIVQKGVERMGGQIGVESTPEQGSRFWFELRRA